jgi:amyloid beta precursor protein binding protein 1
MLVLTVRLLQHSARAATAELPNMAAFLGGLVAQEAIKMVTKQYVPINGYCVVDLVETWTGVIG